MSNLPCRWTIHRWPPFDEELAAEDLITLVVQVNGKVRDRLEIPTGTSKEETDILNKRLENLEKKVQILEKLNKKKSKRVKRS